MILQFKYKYLKGYRLAAFVLLSLLFFCSMTQMQWSIDIHHEEFKWYWVVSTYTCRLADAMLLTLPVLFFRKKKILFPWIILASLYLLSIVF
jgi:hypothetical protein